MISMVISVEAPPSPLAVGEAAGGKTDRRAASTDDEQDEQVMPVMARVTSRRRDMVLEYSLLCLSIYSANGKLLAYRSIDGTRACSGFYDSILLDVRCADGACGAAARAEFEKMDRGKKKGLMTSKRNWKSLPAAQRKHNMPAKKDVRNKTSII